MAQTNEILTSDILSRIFPIKVGDKMGTAFTIEVDGRQYLVTAKHVTNNQEVDKVEIKRIDSWIPIEVRTVGIGEGNEDIIVLAADMKLTEIFDIEIGTNRIALGQHVRFFGYPAGFEKYRPLGRINLPLVKAGILSAIISEEGTTRLLVDGHNNSGFSGGPVIFRPLEATSDRWKIAGVISGYQTEGAVVKDYETGERIGYAEGNSGILIATAIEVALNQIKSNPIGHSLEKPVLHW